MITFGKLLNIMNEEKEASHHKDSKEMRAIRTGLNLNPEFWDEFVQVCNNSDALSELLGVSATTVMGWSSKVKDALNKVQHADSQGQGEEKPKTKIIDTGDDFGGGISVGNPFKSGEQ